MLDPATTEPVIMICDFITPTLAAIFSTVATTATTLTQLSSAQKEKARSRRAGVAEASEIAEKEELLVSRENRLRQRRAAGSGQGTILSGTGTAPPGEIGRNVLLGQ